MSTTDIEFHPCFEVLIIANKRWSFNRVKGSLPSRYIPTQIQILEHLRTKKQSAEKTMMEMIGVDTQLKLARIVSPLIKIGLIKKQNTSKSDGGRVTVYLLDDGVVSRLRKIIDDIKRWEEK